jgi:hypothetical protein
MPDKSVFPGGRYEESDADLIATALRETREETGIPEHEVEVLGTLPLYRTGTGYEVTPVVGLLHSGAIWAGDASEVTEIFTVPLPFLMDDAHHFLHRYALAQEQIRHFYSMPYHDYLSGAPLPECCGISTISCGRRFLSCVSGAMLHKPGISVYTCRICKPLCGLTTRPNA